MKTKLKAETIFDYLQMLFKNGFNPKKHNKDEVINEIVNMIETD